MKKTTVTALYASGFLLFLFFFTVGIGRAHIYRVQDQTTVSLAEMIEDLTQAQIIFIGESHDNAGHHRAQLQVIRELKQKGIKLAIGLEMFRSDSQEDLDRWISGDMPLHEFISVFNDNWSDWEQYRDILHYALFNNIELVGLNLQRSIIRQVARNGFSSLSDEQLGKLPVVACNVDPAYETFIRRALRGHIARDVPFQYFCEAQLLWDQVMAENLLRFMKENPKTTVVVLAGSGHSWKHGIPAQVQKKSDYAYRVLLPEVISRTDQHTLTSKDADYLLQGVEQAPLH